MRWLKRGRVWAPDSSRGWARSYALLPTVSPASTDEELTVYFSSLDHDRYGRIGRIDLNPHDPTEIRSVAEEPVLDLGDLGTFDDCGVNASSLVEVDGKLHLYYIGWQRAERVPYLLFTGLATSTDGGRTFARHSRVPILDRTSDEPFLRSAPCVLRDGGRFHMWYVSAHEWEKMETAHYPNYLIRHAESEDGVTWTADREPAIRYESADEFGFGRPWVVKDGVGYHMWYSIRSRARPYRLGYAFSADGVSWDRRDEVVGIQASESGWDSEMICYACVAVVQGRWLMFYNGNQHGSTGFGLAVRAEDQ